jgi:hypothetical protein
MTASDLLLYTAIVALASAWVELLLIRTGLRDWVEAHGSRWWAEMASCTFCLSWWLCCVISLVAAAIVCDFRLLLCAILATPLTRLMT